jgi:hypothetical protein
MNTLTQRPTRDPLMRVYRLHGTTSGRAATIHDVVRRQVAELARSGENRRSGQVVLPWMATRQRIVVPARRTPSRGTPGLPSEPYGATPAALNVYAAIPRSPMTER